MWISQLGKVIYIYLEFFLALCFDIKHFRQVNDMLQWKPQNSSGRRFHEFFFMKSFHCKLFKCYYFSGKSVRSSGHDLHCLIISWKMQNMKKVYAKLKFQFTNSTGQKYAAVLTSDTSKN